MTRVYNFQKILRKKVTENEAKNREFTNEFAG